MSSRTVYEDAEDGTIDGWLAYGKGNVLNLKETPENRIISTEGKLLSKPFRLGLADQSDWDNTEEFTAYFKILPEEDAAAYFRVDTSDGEKYLCYVIGTRTTMEKDSNFFFFNLEIEPDGQWHVITRDLAKDLNHAQPGIQLHGINDFFVFGSAKLDDIMLIKHAEGNN